MAINTILLIPKELIYFDELLTVRIKLTDLEIC